MWPLVTRQVGGSERSRLPEVSKTEESRGRNDMRWTLVLALVAPCALALVARAADEEKPKYTIKEVMKKAHTPDGGLLKKIVAGEATKADAEQLVELYTALGQN